ncbi:MAG: hypothetical protein LW809_01095 [Vampirovibrionales bacterium]|jgi:hypothetical protein|nr:hypothetical protein [Vampirovibrionales bacterium]
MNATVTPDFSPESPDALKASRDVQLHLDAPPALAWHEVVQGVILNAPPTFEALKNAYGNPAEVDNPLLRQQAILSVSIIAIQLLCGILFKGNTEVSPLVLGFQAVSHLLLWAGLAGGIAYAHHVFTRESRFGLLLTLTGASTIPWLFLPVVSLLKASVPVAGAFAYAILWIWTSYLFVKSVAVVFDWSNEHVMLAMSLPVLAGLWTYLMYFTVIFSLLH